MVYCGKPSGGCHACRARKTRCDRLPEGCTQCKKGKRTCPGYRNPGDLIFRDESSNVVHKLKAREAREAKAAILKGQASAPYRDMTSFHDDTASIASDTSLEIVQQDASPLSAMYTLAPTLEDRAVSLFVHNYVVGWNGPVKGHLYNIADLASSQTLEDCLKTSIKAVGVAVLAHTAHAPSLVQNARFLYMKAIQLTNAALRSPTDVIKDSTLMAIHVLSIFENVTGCKPRSFKDWSEHLHGAAAVIKLRGIDRVKDPGGRHMMMQLTGNLMIVCLQAGTRLPRHIREYMDEAAKHVKVKEATFVVLLCMADYCDFSADIKAGLITDPHTIISKYLELDGILLDIAMNPPLGWDFEAIYTDVESDFVYNGRYDVYFDPWMAQMWNSLRSLRIMLNEDIRDLLLAGFSSKPPRFTEPEYAAQFQLSRETLYQVQADILATVAQHMGQVSLPSKTVSPHRHIVLADNTSQPILMSGGAFLMWPLWFAGILDITTPPVRDFVIRNLHAIANILGIQQARVLARTIEKKTTLPNLATAAELKYQETIGKDG